jgi:hypothetical protein
MPYHFYPQAAIGFEETLSAEKKWAIDQAFVVLKGTSSVMCFEMTRGVDYCNRGAHEMGKRRNMKLKDGAKKSSRSCGSSSCA